jgi:predicted SnoaL-like aldol condensation-catalyzing enzyme
MDSTDLSIERVRTDVLTGDLPQIVLYGVTKEGAARFGLPCGGTFYTLFNNRDYTAAKRFWSDRYIQHSAHIAPGREGLFDLIRSLPETLRYENQLIVAEGNHVIAHGRFSGNGRPSDWIAADIIRFEDGKLAEHWDVLQGRRPRA